jgi:hypothetical protein
MDSLNPHWLSIELSTIDASTGNWNAALRSSYEASFRSLLNNDQPTDAGLNLLSPSTETHLRDPRQ